MSKYFQFKQFTVAQDRAAMKVGTDGVLLGAWAPVNQGPQTILDIGTGTGLIALMLAQRTDAPVIDALELDDAAYEQAVENFEDSPWNDRLFCYHAHLYEFATEIEDTYELIVCNPPYFDSEKSTGDLARDQARQEESMPFDLLVAAVNRLLDPQGVFAVILPTDRSLAFEDLAARAGLFPFKRTEVKGGADKKAKRTLLAFSRERLRKVDQDVLVIEHARHNYTEAYKMLTKDFYLNM